ncbi:MAG TPA: AMP-dependent synthetase/ligase, partial [Marmoricola sp.]|nr:AMP-dependent synthetase/ligase [Marmoricola sp.]
VDITAADFHQQVRSVAAGLIAAGINHGDRVALWSSTRFEWTLVDYAIWYIGAVTVPIYETTSAEQATWILDNSGAVAALVETENHLTQITAAKPDLQELSQVWALCNQDLDRLQEQGATVPTETLDTRRRAVTPDDLATIIYTSGTTDLPKGCQLTHSNFMFELGTAVASLEELFSDDSAATLLFLPLAHVFARIIQVGCVQAGVRMGHSADLRNLVSDLSDFRPTFVLAVPRVFEKIFNTSSQLAVAAGKGKSFDRAAKVAISWSRAMEKGRPSPALAIQHRFFDRLVYAKLRAALGDRCQFALSGGAPLGERLVHFYRGMGIPILEGYGLTETTAALTVNLPQEQKVGTVGRPLPGTSVRVADDGELWFQGGQIFNGYWGNHEATEEVLVDGWFRSGDLGEIDDEGFVRITGRKKEIIITAGGKNVSPGVLENQLRAHLLVDHALVVGEGRPFIGALITLDREQAIQWAQSKGKSTRIRDLVNDPDLVAEIDQAVDQANNAVSRAESIRKFRILPVEWTEESGLLTPSLKLKRNVLLARHADAIEDLYSR